MDPAANSQVGHPPCALDDETSPPGVDQQNEGIVSNNVNETKCPVDTEEGDVHFGERTSPDFSELPEVALVEMMSYLPLHDQYSVSQTCQVLYEVFNHPSLWHTMKIHLFGCADNFSRDYRSKILVPTKYIKLINKFGKFFQHLTLTITGYLNRFPEEWVSIMQELSQQCRLENLTLEIGQITAYYHIYGHQPSEVDLQALLSFVQHAFRLKQLNLKSWPMYPDSLSNEELNIFDVILQNPKLKDLEILKLFWCKGTEWSERKPILPSPEATLPLVKQFRNLTQLSLRSPMLDANIIQELSCPTRSKLKLLQIFTHFVQGSGIFKIPEISSQIWKKFSLANPEVSVECTVLSRTPHLELASLLKPDCPLSAITFMKYSHCDSQILTALTDMYHHRLKCFACYCDPSADEDEIISLVTRCQQLNHLVYYGSVSCQAVEKIAKLRGPQWKEFVIPKEQITIQNALPYDNDDDRVIAPGENGEFYLVALARFHEDFHADDNKLQDLEEKVSAALQYNWKPAK